MTSIGRGRGWATPPTEKPELRRPGGTVSPKSSFDLTSMINDINGIDDESKLKEKGQKIANTIVNLNDRNDVIEMSRKLYDHALNNRNFIPKYTSLLTSGTLPAKVCDVHLQGLFFKEAQDSYTKREKMLDEDVYKFRNAVCILCDGYKYYCTRQINRQMVRTIFPKTLANAIIDYMIMLVESGDEDNIELFAQKITSLGGLLRSVLDSKSAPGQLEKLMTTAKCTLIKNELLSPVSRAMLLYFIELANNNFDPLPEGVKQFYASMFGSKCSSMLQSP